MAVRQQWLQLQALPQLTAGAEPSPVQMAAHAWWPQAMVAPPQVVAPVQPREQTPVSEHSTAAPVQAEAPPPLPHATVHS